MLVACFIMSSTAHAQLKVTAHRGASGYAPENTLASVRKALEIGVDRVEVDVQQTKDGIVVCLHDKKLDRTTDGKGFIRKFNWSDIETLKANAGFESEFPEETIPTLEQVFELMDGRTEFVIEIKAGRQYYPGIEDNVVQLIRMYNAQKWAVVHSFNDLVLEYINDHYPEIRLQKLFVHKPSWLPLMLDFRLHWAGLSDYTYVEAFGISLKGTTWAIVQRAHELGKKVHVWTVNEPTDIQRMVDLEVDGIISNYPDRVKELRAAAKR